MCNGLSDSSELGERLSTQSVTDDSKVPEVSPYVSLQNRICTISHSQLLIAPRSSVHLADRGQRRWLQIQDHIHYRLYSDTATTPLQSFTKRGERFDVIGSCHPSYYCCVSFCRMSLRSSFLSDFASPGTQLHVIRCTILREEWDSISGTTLSVTASPNWQIPWIKASVICVWWETTIA